MGYGGDDTSGQGGRRAHRPATAPLGCAPVVELGCIRDRGESGDTHTHQSQAISREELHSGPEKASAEKNHGLGLLKKLYTNRGVK